jgi:phosphate acetyltransferase
MFSKARQDKQRIVLPEGLDVRVVTAAAELVHRELCEVTLCGDPETIQANAQQANVDVSGCDIVSPQDVLVDNPQPWAEEMVEAFYQARKHKEIKSREMAREKLLSDRAYFGTMMMKQGLADGMVSGTRQSTANTMRPALQLIKMQPGFNIASSVFFMMLRDKVYVYADCAINVDPTAEELAQIAVASAHTARAFGVQPRVAMLSYATGDSNKGPMVDKVIRATAIAKELAPDELIDGPFQIDAAVDPAVAAVKFPAGGPVAGKATVCIFPDLNAANNGYKAVQQATKTVANGPIMQGLRLPVNDLSRGATVEDIVNTAVATALQAQAAKRTQA